MNVCQEYEGHYCYHICQFDTGGPTQKARFVEVLTRSQGNPEGNAVLATEGTPDSSYKAERFMQL